jgi:hypothetical protein
VLNVNPFTTIFHRRNDLLFQNDEESDENIIENKSEPLAFLFDGFFVGILAA